VLAFVATLAFGALTAVPALASGLPTVETKPATGISETKATLNGTVNPNGAETKYHFDYGTSPLYGKKTAELSAGAGNSNVEVSGAIAELGPSTDYYFRLVATNVNGTTNGTAQRFTTTGLPEFVGLSENKPAISTSEPVVLRTTGGGWLITCRKGVTGEGSFTSAKTLTSALTLTGCKLETLFGNTGCNSTGAAAEEIKTGSLEAELVYTSKAAKEVALVFNYRGTAIFATATCNTAKVEVKQGPIVPITPINTSTKTHTLSFTTLNGVQTPTQYENGLGEKIHYVPLINTPGSTFFEEGGISANATILFTKNIMEVKG